jgi:hypothetical protein
MNTIKKYTLISLILLTSIACGSYMGLNDGGSLRTPDWTDPNWGVSEEELVYDEEAPYGIGIPTPPFGVNETHRMYDSEPNRNPELTYYASPDAGYYTHYVDWEDVNATNDDNLFGTVATPRKTIPYRLPAGSVVEVRDTGGSGYTKNAPYPNVSYLHMSGEGTSEYPIFIRGIGSPRFFGYPLRISGRYMVIEGFEFEDIQANFTTTYYSNYGLDYKDHLSFRSNEVHGFDVYGGGAQCVVANADYSVVYDCNIHHNGDVPYGDSSDVHGVTVTQTISNVWILSNEIHHNDGDSIQIMGNLGSGVLPNKIYISLNTMYADRENAVDLKYSENIIVSQNEIYGYNTESRLFGIHEEPQLPYGSDGTACLPSNEGCISSWFMFNHIHDCKIALRIDNELYESVDANVYIVGNVIHDISGNLSRVWLKENDTWISNIAYDVNAAIWCYNDSGQDTSSHKYYNNIISTVIGDYNDVHRAYGDDYVMVTDNVGCLISEMRGNVFYDGGGWQWGSSSYETIEALETAQSDYCSDNVESDPLFTDPENDDFTLSGESPALSIEIESGVQDVIDLYYEKYGIDIGDYVEALFTTGTTYEP